MEHIFDKGVTVKSFAKFVWPSVLMMVVIALYYGIDSVFVANLVGETALASLSIAYPVQGIMWGVAVMTAAGSSAIVAIKMGEGNQKEADEKYTLICVTALIIGVFLTAVCMVFMDTIIDFLGATPELRDYCDEYLSILIWGFPAAFVGVLFEYFIRVDGNPGFTLFLYISGGAVHLVLDYILMGPLDMGIRGAAYANIAGLVTVMIAGGAYFIFRETKLSFRRFTVDWKYIGHCFVNGSSEMVSESSAGIATFFFNLMAVRFAGETGVAAVSIVLNIFYFLTSVHLGYITGVSPLISYYYGAKEYDKVNVFIRYSRWFTLITSAASAVVCLTLARYIVMVFERPGSELFDTALMGTRFLAIAVLFCGVNIFASGFFTAYGNGIISAAISMSRGLIMVIAGIFLLGTLFGMTGVWLVPAFADAATLIITFVMFAKYKNIYNYRIL